jgi:hypothetical protein
MLAFVPFVSIMFMDYHQMDPRAHTPAGPLLTGEWWWAYEGLLYSVRTGKSAHEHVYNKM